MSVEPVLPLKSLRRTVLLSSSPQSNTPKEQSLTLFIWEIEWVQLYIVAFSVIPSLVFSFASCLSPSAHPLRQPVPDGRPLPEVVPALRAGGQSGLANRATEGKATFLKDIALFDRVGRNTEYFKRGELKFTAQRYIIQERTMFDDLRRGYTEDFQGLIEFERTFKDCPKKAPKIKRFCVFGLFGLQNDLESEI